MNDNEFTVKFLEPFVDYKHSCRQQMEYLMLKNIELMEQRKQIFKTRI